MSLRVGQRRFQPRPQAVALTALAVAAFVALGWWQIGRAREKQALIDSFAARGDVSIEVTGQPLGPLPRYQRVQMHGAFLPGRQVLLDNMPSSAGVPGYRVLTPFRRAAGGRLVLVDRGWIPLGRSRHELPVVAVGADDREIAGRLDRLPIPAVRLGAAAGVNATGWPRVLNFPVVTDIEALLGEPLEPWIVLLHPGAADGFERNWRPAVGSGPARNLGYAVQWFAFAIVAIVVFVALSLRPTAAGPER
jgi:surfeit locus 1 family protein